MLLCVGVLLLGWTFRINALTFSVSGRVAAEPLTEPAQITIPTSGTHVTSAPITVFGTCPSDSYVKLYRNNVFSGLGLCSGINNFQIQTDLFAGANALTVRVFNVTDDEGPPSDTVNVFYDVPTPAPDRGGKDSHKKPTAPTPGEKQLQLTTDFLYRGYYVGQTVKWQLTVDGGLAPYKVTVNWGDKHTSKLSLPKPGKFTIEHKYTKPGGYKHGYTIRLTATDTEGHVTNLQLFMIINPAPSAPVAPTANVPTKPPSIFTPKRSWLKYLWPAYGVVALMSISFWLGEKEVLVHLKNVRPGRSKPRHRRA